MFIKLVLVGVAIAFSSLAFAGNYYDAKPSVRDACSRYFSMLEKEGWTVTKSIKSSMRLLSFAMS